MSASLTASVSSCVSVNGMCFSVRKVLVDSFMRELSGATKVKVFPGNVASRRVRDSTVRPRRRSPTIVMRRFSILPNSSCMVKRSRSAWVGCWSVPLPAFMIGMFVACVAS